MAHEIIKGRLYYVALTRKPQDTAKSLYFTTDNTLVYWNFFLDFGPLNLGQTYRFCELLNRLLAAPEHKDKVIYYYSSTHSHRRTNSVMLMCAWALIYLGRTPEEAFTPFEDVYPAFPPFHDASPCVCTYKLTIRKLDRRKLSLQAVHARCHVQQIDARLQGSMSRSWNALGCVFLLFISLSLSSSRLFVVDFSDVTALSLRLVFFSFRTTQTTAQSPSPTTQTTTQSPPPPPPPPPRARAMHLELSNYWTAIQWTAFGESEKLWSASLWTLTTLILRSTSTLRRLKTETSHGSRIAFVHLRALTTLTRLQSRVTTL